MDSSPKTKPGRRPQKDAERKFFTLEHANRTLPLVRRIVADVVAQYRSVAELQAACNAPADDITSQQRQHAETECERAVDKLRNLVDELHEVGCELKDWQLGLIDFPANLGDREVCLCWQLGEEHVEHWHERDAGFRGRQLITPDTFK